ncbi:hypothetical protein NPIL_103961, partial [Nephila pilipes]
KPFEGRNDICREFEPRSSSGDETLRQLCSKLHISAFDFELYIEIGKG